jgi:hypothetical protein
VQHLRQLRAHARAATCGHDQHRGDLHGDLMVVGKSAIASQLVRRD